MPSITSQMPVVITGGVAWSEFTGECYFCEQSIPDGLLRGLITKPLPSVAVIVHASAPTVMVAPALHPARLAAIKEVAKTVQIDLFEQAA